MGQRRQQPLGWGPGLESQPTVTKHRTGGKERQGLGGLPAVAAGPLLKLEALQVT